MPKLDSQCVSNTTKVETLRSDARRPSSRSARTAFSRASLSGLPATSDNINDGTWVTLAARTSFPIQGSFCREAREWNG
jgi:hypothetical protein